MKYATALAMAVGVASTGKIKHIVVLMEENRSFDHFFGYGALAGLKVNGLTGTETNKVKPSDPNSQSVQVDGNALALNPCDPDHSTGATSAKIFGGEAAAKGDFTNATMEGFVQWQAKKKTGKHDYCGVMSAHTPDALPVITAMAQEFAIMDHFFCSHPGPTWPNRMFALSATSAGSTETGPWYRNQVGQLFPQRTFFDQVEEAGLTWRNYYSDTPWELFMEKIAHSPDNVRPLEELYRDAAQGTLPSYAWVNPRSGINMTTG